MALKETEVVILIVLYVIAMLVAFSGNGFLIYIVWKKAEVRSLTSFMFVNMAIADLLVTLVVMPWSITQLYTDGIWMIHGVFGEVMCKGVVYTMFVSVTASILSLTFMAIDRYYAIVHPLRRHLWFRKYKITVPLIWIWSLASMAIFLPTQHLEEHNSECMLSVYILGDPYKAIQGIYLYLVLILYLIPLVVISFLHAIAAWKLWFHVVPGNENFIRNQQETYKKRVVRMLIIVTFAFALCWLPAHVVHMRYVMQTWNIKVNLQPIVLFVCFWFGHANSAINPWLYIFLSSKINTEFKRIVYRKRGRSPPSLCVKTQKEEHKRHDKEPKEEAAELESRL